MPINILMPALSPTMEKGNLAKWLKKEGDKVKSGDVIAEIETDKATMEVEAVDEGTLAKILVPEGTQDVPVNDVIAVLAGDGEDVKAAGAAAGRDSARTGLPAGVHGVPAGTGGSRAPEASGGTSPPRSRRGSPVPVIEASGAISTTHPPVPTRRYARTVGGWQRRAAAAGRRSKAPQRPRRAAEREGERRGARVPGACMPSNRRPRTEQVTRWFHEQSTHASIV